MDCCKNEPGIALKAVVASFAPSLFTPLTAAVPFRCQVLAGELCARMGPSVEALRFKDAHKLTAGACRETPDHPCARGGFVGQGGPGLDPGEGGVEAHAVRAGRDRAYSPGL